ncbi:sodium calcium exchanger protein [Venturia nashicola]|uniref:Sodium calcium exchanger protein n=1 Tax=Venturia nashicola TaxID=86259 RepID=A0A4Z1P4A4_9PEZI|nr:sodium calcium exchanger protein [Venturia nashicola]
MEFQPHTSTPLPQPLKAPPFNPASFVPSDEIITKDNKDLCGLQGATTLPPEYRARIGYLKTFHLPATVTGSARDRELGRRIVDAISGDGIFQIALPTENKVLDEAFTASKEFFSQSQEEKARLVDSKSFAGYIASGEEITDGIADYSEIFTATKDLPASDGRVRQNWPCHGSTPWPKGQFQEKIQNLMAQMGAYGEVLLQLIAFGLELEDPKGLNRLTEDGWHHMRVLRFPATTKTNGKGKAGRGIGSHTDYGLLVIAAQDEVGGLFIRQPTQEEKYANWEVSAAGAHEEDDNWVYVPPQPNVFTVFTGDMMQYITNSQLPSTPHKVGLNSRERFAFAYFHEPNFSATLKTLPEFKTELDLAKEDEGVCYGRHFTNMFMRNYPERITAKQMIAEKRMDKLDQISKTPYPYEATSAKL